MGSHSRPFNDKTGGAIDRKREQERRFMLQMLTKSASDLSTKLVQRLLDRHIIETTDEGAIRRMITDQFERLCSMEDFDVQYKIAPLRHLVPDPNFVSLYLTQYICEDLMNNDKIQDVFGDDLEIYQAVDSVMQAIRPQE